MIDFKTLTNRQGLIVWGGVSSTDLGMVVAEAPAFDKPTKRTDVYTVPGRNGSILFQDGSFEDVQRSYSVWIAEDNGNLTDKVSALTSWLFSQSGYTRLEDNFEPDYYRMAYYSGSNDVSNELTQYGSTTLTFTCRPERFLKSGENAIAVSNGDILANPTKFSSKPLIHIEASGTVAVTINGVTITATVTDYINIDCERMNAYRLEAENYNDKITGAFPVIVPGANAVGIAVTGTLTAVTITPRYFVI